MVFLNSDGSGHIVETTYMSAQAAAMMGGMMSGMGDDMGGDAEVTMSGGPVPDEEEAKAKAADFGEGVAYVSMKEVSKPDGSKGAQIVYKFDDVTKLALKPGSDSSEGGMGMEDEPEEEKEPITFGFSKGQLTVNLPSSDESAASAAPAAPAGGPEDDMAAAMMQGMLPMLKGMRMRMFIKLPAEIKRTNASYVDASSKSGEKRYVTLMDFNFDKLLAADGGMQKFMQAQDNADFGATAKLMAGIPGIKMEPQQTVTIEF